jgi:hypothetical protein
MKRLIAMCALCLLCSTVCAQSGRKGLAQYDPDAEVEAIFRTEGEFRARLVNYMNKTVTTYETPVDGNRYVRVSEIGRRDSGEVFERRRLSRRSSMKRMGTVGYLFSDVILLPELRAFYHLMRLREEDGLVVYAVNPTTLTASGRLFRGEVWVNAKAEIIRARGEWLPRWQDGMFTLTCTVTREKGLPRTIECDDLMSVQGAAFRVLARVEYSDFHLFAGREPQVLEVGDVPEQ